MEVYYSNLVNWAGKGERARTLLKLIKYYLVLHPIRGNFNNFAGYLWTLHPVFELNR